MRTALYFICSCLITVSLMAQNIDTISGDNPTRLIQKKSFIKAPVLFDSDTLFFVKSTKGAYPVGLRSEQISERIALVSKTYNPYLDSLTIKDTNGFIAIEHNTNLIFTVTEADAAIEGSTMKSIAEDRKAIVERFLTKKDPLSTLGWLKRIGLFSLSLLLIYFLIRLINRMFRRITNRLSKIERKFLNRNGSLLRYFLPGNSNNIFVFLVTVFRIILILFLLFICAPFLFSFFPFSENIVQKFYEFIETPIKYVLMGIINFIPSLFFIIIIGITARYFARVINVITADIEKGKLELNKFHKDWARPTGKLLNLLIYALALVLIFPYLPGSGSSAFQGVSIFIGAIISFGSSSAIANIIAGIVITYMRPFQIGDRVKIDHIVGDVIEKTILVTHLRTTKNEDVTIPNANILVGNIINYSSRDIGNIIVHTTITLGYDVPWKTANELLIKAASRAPYLLKDPIPFVLQTSLDDFYVSYELNAYTEEFKKLPLIYSEIHKNILDVFDEAGIEILSPGYIAARDGSPTTIPSQITKDMKSPLGKLIDHLMGKNQHIQIKKSDPNKETD
ncbi:MAG: mechanosensitive ion channel family protein [Flavobacteriaceae bacterium]|nr:mechanosensitive ion channel family protein [Flavobacteriaceae bacterium]